MSTQNVSTYQFQQLESAVPIDSTPGDVLSAAWAEADKIREQAREAGYAAGLAEGIEQGKAEAAPVLTALADAIGAVGDTRVELIEKLTRQAAELAITTTEQIIAGAFEAQPERVIDVTRGAMRRLGDRHRVTVIVNPDDLELLTDAVATLQAELGGVEHLDLQADRRVARGGAIAQTAYGEIDADITTQLERAREIVAAALVGDVKPPANAV